MNLTLTLLCSPHNVNIMSNHYLDCHLRNWTVIHGSPTTNSTHNKYLIITSLANFLLCGSLHAIIRKLQPCNTWASSNEIANFSRKNGRRPNVHQYNKDW